MEWPLSDSVMRWKWRLYVDKLCASFVVKLVTHARSVIEVSSKFSVIYDILANACKF